MNEVKMYMDPMKLLLTINSLIPLTRNRTDKETRSIFIKIKTLNKKIYPIKNNVNRIVNV